MSEKQIAKQEEATSIKFMNKIIAELSSGTEEPVLTNFQKRLAQNYFIVADAILKSAEERRQKRTGKYRDNTPVTWANVDLEKLARSVVSAAKIGWDPLQDNHVSLIPFKDNATGKYLINFMPGYRGIELRAVKYGLDAPDYVTVELVHANDTFKEYKKDRDNPSSTYQFSVDNPFDRGKIIGGFYYHGWTKEPEKNKLVVFTLSDILKRKPNYAAAEFWGGEKTVWKDGKVAGKEETDGWYVQMCWKTIYRAAYRDITIDSQKIDDDYLQLKQIEDSYAESEVEQDVAENANKEFIDVEYDVTEEKPVEEDVKKLPKSSKSPKSPKQKGDKPGF